MLTDWEGFTTLFANGQICLTNNAVERELRSIARGRKAWLFVVAGEYLPPAALDYQVAELAPLGKGYSRRAQLQSSKDSLSSSK